MPACGGGDADHYSPVVQTNSGMWCKPIVVHESTNTGRPADLYRLLLHVGIKVADEWQISLDYVRGSNI